jgi:hypothetical protein
MATKKKQNNDIYKQFEQDDLAHPYRTSNSEAQGKEDWRSVTHADQLSSSEEAYSEKAYEQDYAIQSGEKHEQRLAEKMKRKNSRPHHCKGNVCTDMKE